MVSVDHRGREAQTAAERDDYWAVSPASMTCSVPLM
jgi:hypothetical protein